MQGLSSTLPRAEATAAPCVLVVDDSGAARRALERMLESAGIRVALASSGEEAFTRCLEQPFDLVVTDQRMGALSGLHLCRLLRSDPATASTPVVVLTADQDRRQRFWAGEAGADAYVRKKNTDAELLSVVSELLARPAKASPRTARQRGIARPMERLCEVLDELLFSATVANAARELVAHVGDRATFMTRLLELAGEVADYDYLTLSLGGPLGAAHGVHVRGPWPQDGSVGLAALGLGEASHRGALLLREGADAGAVAPGEPMSFSIAAGGEPLGHLVAFPRARRLGAQDEKTLAVVAREIGIVTKSLFLVEETHRLAHTDGLTGLANRRAATERIAHETKRATRHDTPLAIVLCDVDHFKQVNDRYGHVVGDEVLRRVAAALESGVRSTDLVARWGGEELMVVLPNAGRAGARIVAERIRALVARDAGIPGSVALVTISAGVAHLEPGMRSDPDNLVARADEALYRAKERGRNRVEVG